MNAVCAVFGDPHYRTFDGHIYNFQGTCSYTLAKDCHGRNFSVRVRNDARLTNDFAWTKVVGIRVGQWRISLQQHLKVKVNRKRVQLPFNEPGVFAILNQGGFSVTLKTAFGLKVIWDGDSYLEVMIPPSYKHQMCGLCGNYNGIRNDDLIGKDGILYFNPYEFGETWRTGKRKSCMQKPRTRTTNDLPCKKQKHRSRAQMECSLLHATVFSSCRDKLDVTAYYK